RRRIGMRSTRLTALLTLGLTLSGGTATRAGAPRKPLEVMDLFNLQLATDPQIAPDGKRIIYVRHFCDIMKDKRHSNLWVINADGSEHRPLTTGNYNDSSPRWSPDGRQLAYLSNRDGSPQIYSRWMDTGQTARLTTLTSPPAGLAWSPDGKWI